MMVRPAQLASVVATLGLAANLAANPAAAFVETPSAEGPSGQTPSAERQAPRPATVMERVRRAMGLSPRGPMMLLPAPRGSIFVGSAQASTGASRETDDAPATQPPSEAPAQLPLGTPVVPAALEPQTSAAPAPRSRPAALLRREADPTPARVAALPRRNPVRAAPLAINAPAERTAPPNEDAPAEQAASSEIAADNTDAAAAPGDPSDQALTAVVPPGDTPSAPTASEEGVEEGGEPAAPAEADTANDSAPETNGEQAGQPSDALADASSADPSAPLPSTPLPSNPLPSTPPAAAPVESAPLARAPLPPAPLPPAEERPASAATAVRQPTPLPRLMRMMSALQDDAARGSTAALAAQRVLARRLIESIDATPPEALAAPRAARAFVVYALTGGSPPLVRRTMDRVEFPPPDDVLLRGALAYIEGRREDAVRHLKDIDTQTLPATVQGPLHLALAALSVADDPKVAITHLDAARLVAPGTLVEEAALRRTVLIAAEQNDLPTFAQHTNRYLRKFRRSVYAGNFRRRIAGALTRMEFLGETDGFEALDTILTPMTPSGRREILLDLARTAVETGRSTVAADAAARAAEELSPDAQTLDARRAALYGAAALVVDPQRTSEAVAALETVDTSGLPEADIVLRDAATRLGQSVASLPPLIAGPPQPDPVFQSDQPNAQAAGNPEASDAEDPELSAVTARVNSALADIDTLLRSSE